MFSWKNRKNRNKRETLGKNMLTKLENQNGNTRCHIHGKFYCFSNPNTNDFRLQQHSVLKKDLKAGKFYGLLSYKTMTCNCEVFWLQTIFSKLFFIQNMFFSAFQKKKKRINKIWGITVSHNGVQLHLDVLKRIQIHKTVT